MDLYDAYFLGENVEWLKDVINEEACVDVKGNRIIIDELEIIFNSLFVNKLSENTQYEIKRYIDKLNMTFKVQQMVKHEDVVILKERLKIWSDRISTDLNERKVIEVFTDGILNPKHLMIGGISFFREEIWNELSDISKNDLNDACHCLLTQSWTPAVMISLRAAEDSVRILYKTVTGKDVKKKSLYNIIEELKKEEQANKILLNYLDYVRSIRNRAEHPDEIFSQYEADRVFLQVVDMIIVINEELSPSVESTL